MYFNKNVNQKAILDFVNKFKEIGELQQFAIMHNDELQVKFAIYPYETTDVKQFENVEFFYSAINPRGKDRTYDCTVNGYSAFPYGKD